MYADCAKNKAKTQHFSGSGWKLVFDLACTNFGGRGGGISLNKSHRKNTSIKEKTFGSEKDGNRNIC